MKYKLLHNRLVSLLFVASAGLSPSSYASDLPVLITKGGFNGAWEKDYARSDNWERRIQQKLAELRRQAEQRNRRSDNRANIGGVVISNSRSGTNVIDLARFAELISRHHNMDIVQDDKHISITREGEAKLLCNTSGKLQKSQNEFGSESCLWDGRRLIFKIKLEEGTVIYHRFLLSPAGNSINLLTRVSHPGSATFELVQFYNRYSDSYDSYQCKQTLSRGKVCSLRPARKED